MGPFREIRKSIALVCKLQVPSVLGEEEEDWRVIAGAAVQFTSALTLCRSMAGISNGISHPNKEKVTLDISTGNSNANRPQILLTFFPHTSNSHTYVKGKR